MRRYLGGGGLGGGEARQPNSSSSARLHKTQSQNNSNKGLSEETRIERLSKGE